MWQCSNVGIGHFGDVATWRCSGIANRGCSKEAIQQSGNTAKWRCGEAATEYSGDVVN